MKKLLVLSIVIFSMVSFGQNRFNGKKCDGKLLGWAVWNGSKYQAFSGHEGLASNSSRSISMILPKEANKLSKYQLILSASVGYATNPGVGWEGCEFGGSRLQVDVGVPVKTKLDNGQWLIGIPFKSNTESYRYISVVASFSVPKTDHCIRLGLRCDDTGPTPEPVIRTLFVDCMCSSGNNLNAYMASAIGNLKINQIVKVIASKCIHPSACGNTAVVIGTLKMRISYLRYSKGNIYPQHIGGIIIK